MSAVMKVLILKQFSKATLRPLWTLKLRRIEHISCMGEDTLKNLKGDIWAMYNHSMWCHESYFVKYGLSSLSSFSSTSGSGDVMFEGNASHIGPLYWFPDKCCLIPGHEPAASPSFLHTTWGSMRFSSSSCLTLASSCLT